SLLIKTGNYLLGLGTEIARFTTSSPKRLRIASIAWYNRTASSVSSKRLICSEQYTKSLKRMPINRTNIRFSYNLAKSSLAFRINTASEAVYEITICVLTVSKLEYRNFTVIQPVNFPL